MGWNDILGKDIHNYEDNKEGDYVIKSTLNSQTIIHFWKGDVDLMTDAIRQGFDIVNAYHLYTYMDYDFNSLPLDKSDLYANTSLWYPKSNDIPREKIVKSK